MASNYASLLTSRLRRHLQRSPGFHHSHCRGLLTNRRPRRPHSLLRIGTTCTEVGYHIQEYVMTIGLILSLIFMVLKLTDNIDWNWGLVFLPAIIEFVLSLVVYRSPFWWRGRSN